MAHEAAAAAKAIKANLAADATLIALIAATKHFAESAPQDAALPYIVFRQRSPGEDVNPLHTKRCMTSPLYDVGVWVEGDPHSTTAQTVASRIDAVMNVLASYSVTDATNTTFEVSARSEGGAWVREEYDKETKKKYYWVGRSYRLSIAEP